MAEFKKLSDQEPIEIRVERLRAFYQKLWNLSLKNPGGDTTQVTRYGSVDGEGIIQPVVLSSLQIPLKPQIDKCFEKWMIMTDKLLITTENKPKNLLKNLSIREPAIQRIQTDLLIPKRESEGDTMPLKFSSLRGVLDLEPKTATWYPPDPENGRPGLRFRITEIFTDSRKSLLGVYFSIIEKIDKKRMDTNLLSGLRQSIINTSLPIAEVLPKIESTPFTVVELTARTTFFDSERKLLQPANLAGWRFTETLDGSIRTEILSPWIGHETWEKLAESPETDLLGMDYFKCFDLLDQNIGRIANALS